MGVVRETGTLTGAPIPHLVDATLACRPRSKQRRPGRRCRNAGPAVRRYGSTIGPHAEVKGRNTAPGRLIWNIDEADVNYFQLATPMEPPQG
jgi:hypothetical protein